VRARRVLRRLRSSGDWRAHVRIHMIVLANQLARKVVPVIKRMVSDKMLMEID